jgi:hypothetical protein
MSDIIIEGSITESDGTKHEFKLKLTKGEKGDGKKRRDDDKIEVEASALMDKGWLAVIRSFISNAKLKWNAPEANNFGGWSGYCKEFGLQVHCKRRKRADGTDDPTDDPPYILIEIPEKQRAAAEAAGQKIPDPLKFKFKGNDTEQHAEQDKINDYFKDGELPQKVYF